MLLRRSEDSLEKKSQDFLSSESKSINKNQSLQDKVGKQNSTIQYYIP